MSHGLLRNRAILAVLVAETVSMTGSQMTWLAIPWFVLATTGSAARMGVVLAAEGQQRLVGGIAFQPAQRGDDLLLVGQIGGGEEGV